MRKEAFVITKASWGGDIKSKLNADDQAQGVGISWAGYRYRPHCLCVAPSELHKRIHPARLRVAPVLRGR